MKSEDNYLEERSGFVKTQKKRALALAVLALVLAAASLAVYLLQGKPRFLISALLALVWAAIQFAKGVSGDTFPDPADLADERDVWIAMKSSRAALRRSNALVLGGILVFGLLYGVWRQPVFLTVAITLCAVMVLLLVTLLAANIYFEKKN